MDVLQSAALPMLANSFSSIDELIETLANIGFSGIEIWGREKNFQTIVRLAAKHRLTFLSMVGHSAPLNRLDLHVQAEREIKESIDIAASEGIRSIICFSGNRYEGLNDLEAIPVVAQGFFRVIEYAEAKKVNLLLELLNSKVDHLGYQADHTAWGLRVCEKVASPRLRLLYDIYHMQIMEGDVIRTIRSNSDWIGHFHTAGVPGRQEIGLLQELNYGAVSAAIRATGYAGFIGHEFKPAGDPKSALREAFCLCKD